MLRSLSGAVEDDQPTPFQSTVKTQGDLAAAACEHCFIQSSV